MNQIINFIRIYKGYGWGMGVGGCIYFLSTILFTNFSVMGVDLSEFWDFLLGNYFWLILYSHSKLLLFSLVWGGLWGFILPIKNKSEWESVYFKKILPYFWIGLIILSFIHSIIYYPQLYSGTFLQTSSILVNLQYFLTDHIHPSIPSFLNGAIVVFIFLYFIYQGFTLHKRKLLSIKGDRIFTQFIGFSLLLLFHIQGNFILLILLFLFLPWFDFIWKKISLYQILSIQILAYATLILGFFSEIYPFGFDSLWERKSEVNSQSLSESKSNSFPVIIIACDSLRTDRLGFISGNRSITPHIDNFRKDAIYFSDHHTTIPRTFPSWTDLLTGRLSLSHGITSMFPDRESVLDLSRMGVLPLPEILRKYDYYTFVVGTFAADIFPRANFGFDLVETPHFHASILAMQKILESQVFYLPLWTGSFLAGGKYWKEVESLPSLGDGKRIIPHYKKLIRKSKDRNFFGIYFSSVAHFPYSPPYPDYKKFTDPKYYGKYKYTKFVDPSSDFQPKEHEILQIRNLYDSAIYSFDKEVGDILSFLKKEDMYDKSLIILTSDHGEALYESDHGQGHGEHLRGESVTKVPLLIKLPKKFEEKNFPQEYKGISSSLDIYPMIVDAIGMDPNKSIQNKLVGYSLLDKLNRENIRNQYAYSETGVWFSDRGDHFFQKKRIPYPNILELHEIDWENNKEIRIQNHFYKKKIFLSKHRAVLSSRYKLIYIPTREGVEYEFYDRILDPDNNINLYSQPELAQEIKKMKYFLLRFMESGQIEPMGEYILPNQ